MRPRAEPTAEEEEGLPIASDPIPSGPMDAGVRIELLRRAGGIAGAALDLGAGLIKPGVSLLSVAEAVEGFIATQGGHIGFPVNIAIDDQAAHYTPLAGEETTFESGQVVKLDVGVHVNGFIGDTARTIEVGTRNRTELLRASRDALAVAIETIRPGVTLGAVGTAIGQCITDAGYQPVANLTGHSVERYNLHAGLSVPNVNDRNTTVVRPGMVFAIEPFATDGFGRVEGRKPSNIYRLRRKTFRFEGAERTLLAWVADHHGSLPFAMRYLEGVVASPRRTITTLVNKGAISSYPILWEVEGGMVSQHEHTMLIGANGAEVLTEPRP